MSADRFNILTTETMERIDSLAGEWLGGLDEPDAITLVSHLAAHFRACGYISRMLQMHGIPKDAIHSLGFSQSLAGHMDAQAACDAKGAH